jgi:hypothetical protein
MPLNNRQIAEVVYTAVARHEVLVTGVPPRPWEYLSERYQRRACHAVEKIREQKPLEGPENLWSQIKEPDEPEFNDLPIRFQEQIFLMCAIVCALTNWTDAPYPEKAELNW